MPPLVLHQESSSLSALHTTPTFPVRRPRARRSRGFLATTPEMVANVSTIITTSQLSSSSCCLQTTSDTSVHIDHIDMGSATSLDMNTHQMAKDASPSSLGDAPALEKAANYNNNTAHNAAPRTHRPCLGRHCTQRLRIRSRAPLQKRRHLPLRRHRHRLRGTAFRERATVTT